MELRIASTWDGAPADPAEVASVRLRLTPAALEVWVAAPFHGDPAPPVPAGPCWGLWDFEAVELFVLGQSGQYTELELGPHGHHLLLGLAGLRQIVRRELPVSYAAKITEPLWSGHAVVSRAWLPPRPWRGNAYAIHGTGATRRYLAHTPVPGRRPDFHRLDAFPPLPVPDPTEIPGE